MAISESDYLHLHKGHTTLLLLRGPAHFHCVTVDAAMTEQRFQKLLRIYPCDIQKLRALGLQVSAFKKETLGGVVLTGYQTGDTIELWVGCNSQQYALGSDYTDAALSAFFEGHTIVRRLPPKWEGLPHSTIRGITWGLNSAAIAASLLFLIVRTPYALWSSLCMLCQLTALLLPILFPASFTLADFDRKILLCSSRGKGHLCLALIIPGLVLSLRTITDFTFGENSLWWLLGISCITFLLIFGGMLWFFRRAGHRRMLSAATIISMLFLGMGTAGQLNHVLDTSPPRQIIAEVEVKEVHYGIRSNTYHCVVQFPDETYKAFSLPRRDYLAISEGSEVTVKYHTGAFQIPYCTVEPMK